MQCKLHSSIWYYWQYGSLQWFKSYLENNSLEKSCWFPKRRYWAGILGIPPGLGSHSDWDPTDNQWNTVLSTFKNWTQLWIIFIIGTLKSRIMQFILLHRKHQSAHLLKHVKCLTLVPVCHLTDKKWVKWLSFTYWLTLMFSAMCIPYFRLTVFCATKRNETRNLRVRYAKMWKIIFSQWNALFGSSCRSRECKGELLVS